MKASSLNITESLTIRAYGLGKERLKFDKAGFYNALNYLAGRSDLYCNNDADYDRLLVSFDSDYYPLKPGEAVPGIVMRWMGNYTTREEDIAFVIDIPRGKGLKSYGEIRELTERESTLPEAVKNLLAYTSRPIDKMALRNLSREGTWPKMEEVYRQVFHRLFYTVPEVETMHTMRGFDEATVAAGSKILNLSELTFDRVEKAIPEWEREGIMVNAVPAADCILVAWKSDPLFNQRNIQLTLEVEFNFENPTKFYSKRRGLFVKNGFFHKMSGWTELEKKTYSFEAVPASFPAELAPNFPEWEAVFNLPYRKIIEPFDVVNIEDMHTLRGYDERRSRSRKAKWT
jgi:hypothetical protein